MVHEPELDKAVRAETERAEQRPCLATMQLDPGGNKRGMDGAVAGLRLLRGFVVHAVVAVVATTAAAAHPVVRVFGDLPTAVTAAVAAAAQPISFTNRDRAARNLTLQELLRGQTLCDEATWSKLKQSHRPLEVRGRHRRDALVLAEAPSCRSVKQRAWLLCTLEGGRGSRRFYHADVAAVPRLVVVGDGGVGVGNVPGRVDVDGSKNRRRDCRDLKSPFPEILTIFRKKGRVDVCVSRFETARTHWSGSCSRCGAFVWQSGPSEVLVNRRGRGTVSGDEFDFV